MVAIVARQGYARREVVTGGPACVYDARQAARKKGRRGVIINCMSTPNTDATDTTPQTSTQAPARVRTLYMKLPPSSAAALVRYDAADRIIALAGMAVQFCRGENNVMFHTHPKEFGEARAEHRAPRLLQLTRPKGGGRLFPVALEGHAWDRALEQEAVTPGGGSWGVISMMRDGPQGRPILYEERIRSEDWLFAKKPAVIQRSLAYSLWDDGLPFAEEAFDLARHAHTAWAAVRRMTLDLGMVRPETFPSDGRITEGLEAIGKTRNRAVWPLTRTVVAANTAVRTPMLGEQPFPVQFAPEMLDQIAAAIAARTGAN